MQAKHFPQKSSVKYIVCHFQNLCKMHGPEILVENTKNMKKISEKNISKLSVKYTALTDQGKVHDSSKCKIHSEECIV